MAWLEIIYQDGSKQKVEVQRSATGVVLGRSASCHIVIRSQAVGRNHGKIVFRDGAFYYRDLGSVNGSFVNGKRVADEVALKDNDQIRCGDVLLRFIADKAQEPPQRPSQEALGLSYSKATQVVGSTPPVSSADAASLVELTRLRKENEALRLELSSLRKQLKEGEESLAPRLKEVERLLSEKEDEVRHLRGLVSDYERRLQEAERRAATATSSLDSMHSKYLDMRDQLSHMQDLLDEARRESQALEAEAAQLRETVASLEAQLQVVHSRSGQTSEEIANLKIKITEKDREIEHLRRELDIREYDLKALKEENERLQEFCQSDSGRQGQLERKIRNLEAVIEENSNYIAELRRIIEEKDRELRAVRMGVGLADLEQEKQRLLDDYHKKSREVDDLRSQIASLSADLASARAEIEDLQTRLRQAEEAARTRKSEREDISDHPEYKALVRLSERQAQEIEALTKEVETLRAERQEFSSEEKARLTAELQASQERIQTLLAKLDEAQRRLHGASSEGARRALPQKVLEAASTLLDDVRVFQVEAKGLMDLLTEMANNPQLPISFERHLRGVSLPEAVEALRDVMRVIEGDVNALADALKSQKVERGFEE